MTQTDSKSADASGERCRHERVDWSKAQIAAGGAMMRTEIARCPDCAAMVYRDNDADILSGKLAPPAALPADERDVCKRPGCGLPYEAPVHGSGTGFGTAREAYRMHPFAHSWADERERTTEQEHYRSLIEHVGANSVRHPWYGPCDGIGKGGSCCECDNLIASLRAELAEAQRERDGLRGTDPNEPFLKIAESLSWPAADEDFEQAIREAIGALVFAHHRMPELVADNTRLRAQLAEAQRTIHAQTHCDGCYGMEATTEHVCYHKSLVNLHAENERLRAELVNPHG